jgi:glutaminase
MIDNESEENFLLGPFEDEELSIFKILSDEEDFIYTSEIKYFLEKNGFLQDDPRFIKIYEFLSLVEKLDLELFHNLFKDHFAIISKAILNKLIIPQFNHFSKEVSKLYKSFGKKITDSISVCPTVKNSPYRKSRLTQAAFLKNGGNGKETQQKIEISPLKRDNSEPSSPFFSYKRASSKIKTGTYEANQLFREMFQSESQNINNSQNKFGVSICTVDGQRINLGLFGDDIVVKSLSKLMVYAITLELLGEGFVHEHVDKEPSGQDKDSFILTPEGNPYNPLTNSGTQMLYSLLLNETQNRFCDIDQKADIVSESFEIISNFWRRLSGGVKPGFSNVNYMASKMKSEVNLAIGHFMKSRGKFCSYFGNKSSEDVVGDIIYLYNLCSAIEMKVKDLAVMAASLANGGICPLTGERVLSTDTSRALLSIMHSCGLHDESGQFAYSIGLPAKNSSNGILLLVVPGLLGICLYSPPTQDNLTNRCIEFASKLVEKFNFHNFDNTNNIDCLTKVDPRIYNKQRRQIIITEILFACFQNNVNLINRMIKSGLDMNVKDYDSRSTLHIAASEGHFQLVKLLIQAKCNPTSKDRWKNTPIDDAKRNGHYEIVEMLEEYAKSWS